MSDITSRTGLIASPTKKVATKHVKKRSLQLKATSVPAPVVLKPYAGLYNPYPYGCSLLCNHPTDKEAKDVLKRARETWATENKNVIAPDEIQAIRDSLICVEESKPLPPPEIDNIPEELFRRYTETDSRPLTPAPTLASVKTRGSSSRRCVTPDPIITSVLRERTLLILDLRRSHSQEIISWQGSGDTPLVNVLREQTPSISVTPSEISDIPSRKETAKSRKSPSRSPPREIQKLEVPKIIQEKLEDVERNDGEEEIVKRKGKRRKKRGRDSSRGPLAVQASVDPETQIATLGTDSNDASARQANYSGNVTQDANNINNQHPDQRSSNVFNANVKSILEPKILKHLQRDLTAEIVDLEFNEMKRAALEEAFRTIPAERKQINDELKQLIDTELGLTSINVEMFLSLPRVFSRNSARFELPLHSRTLNTLTPLQYLKNHCMVSNGRKLLYNLVFNRHRDFQQLDETLSRYICNDEIEVALGEMMGKKLTSDQFNRFRNLVNAKNTDIIDFRTWCGMCALFERVFAVEFCHNLPGKHIDPCNAVELADFQSLERRLNSSKPDECLSKMLYLIKEL